MDNNFVTNLQFKQFNSIVYSESGIHLTDQKKTLLNARLLKRLRALNVNAKQYLSIIKNNKVELQNFIDAISTNHTFFFREPNAFRFLDNFCKKIWCAASSSGEEPYSLAIYCMNIGFAPNILATDISQSCLEKGRKGVYKKESIAKMPSHILKSFFQKGTGKMQDYVKVKKEIRNLVRFEQFNLLKDIPPSTVFDIIFCRNVMIYFDNPTKQLIVEKLCNVLKTNGYFIIGGSESLSSFKGLQQTLKYVEPSVYMKK